MAYRLARRRRWWVWWQVPVVSPYADRLRQAAVGGHVCQHFPVSSEHTDGV